MPTVTVEIRELPARFSEVLSLAGTGTEVIVTENQVPRARLVPFASERTRTPGLHPGTIQTSDDFDAPLPDDFWTDTL